MGFVLFGGLSRRRLVVLKRKPSESVVSRRRCARAWHISHRVIMYNIPPQNPTHTNERGPCEHVLWLASRAHRWPTWITWIWLWMKLEVPKHVHQWECTIGIVGAKWRRLTGSRVFFLRILSNLEEIFAKKIASWYRAKYFFPFLFAVFSL